jgi:hypothetical protein
VNPLSGKQMKELTASVNEKLRLQALHNGTLYLRSPMLLPIWLNEEDRKREAANWKVFLASR